MQDAEQSQFTPRELRDFRRLAGFMVPASAEYGVPGADDETIFADILRSLGRDRPAVRDALADLSEQSHGAFADLDRPMAEAVATAFLHRKGAVFNALGRAVLQCYYRDDRVIVALGLEPRPPFPKGHVLPDGDWSLLEPIRGRRRMWRDVDGRGD